MSDFEKLLAELEAVSGEQGDLSKAMPADDGDLDDEAIAAAAEEGEGETGEEGGDELPENPEDADDADEGEEGTETSLTKSMVIDGEECEVVDAEALLKSLTGLTDRVEAHEQVLAKALEQTVGTIKAQGDMIKSLSARMEKLAGQGRGRKTVIAVHEKPSPGEQPMAKSEPAAPTYGEIMAKCLTAQRAGTLTGLDVSRVEIALNNGQAAPQDVLARINHQ